MDFTAAESSVAAEAENLFEQVQVELGTCLSGELFPGELSGLRTDIDSSS